MLKRGAGLQQMGHTWTGVPLSTCRAHSFFCGECIVPPVESGIRWGRLPWSSDVEARGFTELQAVAPVSPSQAMAQGRSPRWIDLPHKEALGVTLCEIGQRATQMTAAHIQALGPSRLREQKDSESPWKVFSSNLGLSRPDSSPAFPRSANS